MKNRTALKAAAICIAIIVFAGVFSLGLTISAAGSINLSVSKITANPGDEITVSVTITPDSKVSALEFTITHDTTKLQYKSHKSGPASGGCLNSFNPNFPSSGNKKTGKSAIVHMEGITQGGSLLDITFIVLPGWTGSTSLDFAVQTCGDKDQKNLDYTAESGSVTVKGSPPAVTTTAATTVTTTSATSITTTRAEIETTAAQITSSTATATEPTTKAEVKVPDEEVEEALGPDNDDWDKDYTNLDDEQKEKIEEFFEKDGTPVEIKSDGVYYKPSDGPQRVGNSKVKKALGSEAEQWDGNYSALNPGQIEKIEKYFEEQGTSVEVKDDGVYFAETATEEPLTSIPGSDTGLNTKLIIGIAVVAAVLLIVGLILFMRSRKREDGEF